MSVRVSSHSRLNFTEFLSFRGTEFFDLLDLPDIPRQIGDLSYMVVQGDRIDRLAYRFYNDPNLWWVIAAANNLELVPTDLNMGDVLRIPSPPYVLQRLFQTVRYRDGQ